ncbi:MAG: transposase [Candidatus Firestonebacteria bacterium]
MKYVRVGAGLPAQKEGRQSRPNYCRRNTLRLKIWDYYLIGPYFFTICTFKRKEIFIFQTIRNKIIEIFKTLADELKVSINAIVVANNHIHGLITLPEKKTINLWEYIAKAKVKTTQTIFNGRVNPPLRENVWQRSFYDYVIRNQDDFFEKAKYIENHPIKEEGNIYTEWH